jgi:Rieske Fe-S protein
MNNQLNSANSEQVTSAGLATSRRSFVGVIIGLIWTTITGTIGVVAARFVAAPTSGAVPSLNWTDIGPLKNIPDATPTKHEVVIQQDSGWARFTSLRSVWIVRRGQNAMVFSATCPHLGCTVDASANGFACPCHGSSWSVRGEKLGGPTPRGLDALESHIDGDTLKVRYQDFKQGTADKQSV